MFIHGYFAIDDNYFLDIETTHFSNDIRDMTTYLENNPECEIMVKHVFEKSISRGLNPDNYVIYCGDEITMMFDKTFVFKWDGNDGLSIITEMIIDFDKWVNKTFNEKNVEIINTLMELNDKNVSRETSN